MLSFVIICLPLACDNILQHKPSIRNINSHVQKILWSNQYLFAFQSDSVDIYRSRYSFDICHLRNANMYFLFNFSASLITKALLQCNKTKFIRNEWFQRYCYLLILGISYFPFPIPAFRYHVQIIFIRDKY